MTFHKKYLFGFLAAVSLAGAGCGSGTYPVQGTVELSGGNIDDLSGSAVEIVNKSDPNVRATGEIQPDGRFELETIQSGKVLKGAPEGAYDVRIVLNDDDPKSRRRAAKSVAPRYLDFRTSGMTIHVPSESPVVLQASKTK